LTRYQTCPDGEDGSSAKRSDGRQQRATLTSIATQLEATARELRALVKNNSLVQGIESHEWHQAWEKAWLIYIRDRRECSPAS